MHIPLTRPELVSGVSLKRNLGALMELFLTQAGADDLRAKIKKDPQWLNQERLNYIVANNVHVLNDLDPSTLAPSMLSKALQNQQSLIHLAQMIEYNRDPKSKIKDAWATIVTAAIKKPLGNEIFSNQGVLLNFLPPSDYEQLGLQWIERAVKLAAHDPGYGSGEEFTYITPSLQKLMQSEQVLAMKQSKARNAKWISWQFLSPQAQTLEVARACMNALRPHEIGAFYKGLPITFQDDEEIAYAACKHDKQFYKQLSPKAQTSKWIISHVTHSVIYATSDTDCDHDDESAIKRKELPLEVVKTIEDPGMMRSIFADNKSLLSNEFLHNKWLTSKKYALEFIEFYDHLSPDTKKKVVTLVSKMNAYDKGLLLIRQPKLAALVIDKTNVKETIETLCRSVNPSASSIDKMIDKLGLNSVVETNLPTMCEVFGSQGIDMTLHLAHWFMRRHTKNKSEYDKEFAISLLIPLVQKEPDLLTSNLDYRYRIETSVFRPIKLELFERIDALNQNTSTSFGL